jgi:hypothetical protein
VRALWVGVLSGPGSDASGAGRYANDVLRKEFLPHVGNEAGWETRKAFFFGYMIHRLLLAVLSPSLSLSLCWSWLLF